MKILVTGANGYIGRHLVTALIEHGHRVLACDVAFDGVYASGRAHSSCLEKWI